MTNFENKKRATLEIWETKGSRTKQTISGTNEVHRYRIDIDVNKCSQLKISIRFIKGIDQVVAIHINTVCVFRIGIFVCGLNTQS